MLKLTMIGLTSQYYWSLDGPWNDNHATGFSQSCHYFLITLHEYFRVVLNLCTLISSSGMVPTTMQKHEPWSRHKKYSLYVILDF